MYLKSVGRNSTLILGITPDTSGLIPAGDFKRLEEFGKEINRLFDNPIAKVNSDGLIAVIKNEKKYLSHISCYKKI
ncbi:hypothetical protein [Sphingobacterium bovisgrunnientis]|uniref:hypothetical protein n=1 Tax=Sphingobacterium bovisgrunnientis TaxID=1874697 RepID=UPI00195EC0E3|nr:hypothetical protein [Sphingobacterium bovisgrunnientis]